MQVHIFREASLRHITIALLSVLAASCTTGPDLSKVNTPPVSNISVGTAEKEIAGAYAVTGSAENEQDPYQGSLTVSNQGDTYKFDLQTSRAKLTGVGVQFGDSVAVTYSEPSKGKDCGVALYRIAPGGVLDGRIAMWGETKYGSEHAAQAAGTNFDGKYNVNGTTSSGQPYAGTLDVSKMGGGYRFAWHTGNDTFGFGIWRGDRAAIGLGGPQCFFALYDIRTNGVLEGFTGGGTSMSFGTVSAKKS